MVSQLTMIIIRAAGLRLRAARLRSPPPLRSRSPSRPKAARPASRPPGNFLAGGSRIAVPWP